MWWKTASLSVNIYIYTHDVYGRPHLSGAHLWRRWWSLKNSASQCIEKDTFKTAWAIPVLCAWTLEFPVFSDVAGNYKRYMQQFHGFRFEFDLFIWQKTTSAGCMISTLPKYVPEKPKNAWCWYQKWPTKPACVVYEWDAYDDMMNILVTYIIILK